MTVRVGNGTRHHQPSTRALSLCRAIVSTALVGSVVLVIVDAVSAVVNASRRAAIGVDEEIRIQLPQLPHVTSAPSRIVHVTAALNRPSGWDWLEAFARDALPLVLLACMLVAILMIFGDSARPERGFAPIVRGLRVLALLFVVGEPIETGAAHFLNERLAAHTHVGQQAMTVTWNLTYPLIGLAFLALATTVQLRAERAQPAPAEPPRDLP